MDFSDKINQFSKRIETLKNNLTTEEATKTALIMPLFQILEYDIFNPLEFMPEFIADVGVKKGEKVDYAILKDGKPLILIEAKCASDKLKKHDAQLFRYFTATEAKFAILTNGIIYKFFTDLEEKNKMDEKPFLILNLLSTFTFSSNFTILLTV
ncbi:type I restriction endonuclease [Clostridioides difficile]|uniref:type I restriction endonuclease n=1 Tax=Clostridioides difficile TaxID=1496 RepID=UPI002ED61326